MADRPED